MLSAHRGFQLENTYVTEVFWLSYFTFKTSRLGRCGLWQTCCIDVWEEYRRLFSKQLSLLCWLFSFALIGGGSCRLSLPLSSFLLCLSLCGWVYRLESRPFPTKRNEGALIWKICFPVDECWGWTVRVERSWPFIFSVFFLWYHMPVEFADNGGRLEGGRRVWGNQWEVASNLTKLLKLSYKVCF
jgi:hypothetical protein